MEPEFFEPSETHPVEYHLAYAKAAADRIARERRESSQDTEPAEDGDDGVGDADDESSTGRAPLTIRTIGELCKLPDVASELILSNGYLECGERTAICGMGGIGKSRLVMQLAMMHRAGLPFLAWETRATELRWLFLQTENGNRRLKSDLNAMLGGFTSAQRRAIESGIYLHTIEAEDDGHLLLTDPDNRLRAMEAIRNACADIVVWDPLRDFTGDDLNKDMAMNETLRAIRTITRAGDPRRTCLVIHHAGEGKAGVAKAIGYDRGAFGRNSKTLKTWARAQFNIAPATPDDNSQIIVASGKCNNFAEFPPICARLNPETMLYELVEDFDFEAWKDSLINEREKPGTDKVLEILREAGGGLEKNEVVARMQAQGWGRDLARGLIRKAVEESLIEETYHQRSGARPSILLTPAGK
jgi:RecA-family ATPase